MKVTRDQLEEVIKAAIYHGRYFSRTRDKLVIKKSVDYILDLIEELLDGTTEGG